MKKVGDILLTVFGAGVLICLLAGGLSSVGYIVALCIGGEAATALSLFVFEEYLPWVIRITAIFVGLGLLGMYLTKVKSLSIKGDDAKRKDEKA